MSDRLITAEEARDMLDSATEGSWMFTDDGWDFYEVLGRNPGRSTFPIICDVDDEDDAALIAAAPDLAATVIAQSEQIDKVREVRSIINRLITYSGEAVSMDSTTLAKSIVNKLNDALGDIDD